MSYESYEQDAHQLESHQIRVPYADEPGLIPHDITVNMVTFAGQNPSTLVAMGMGNEGRAPYLAQANIARGHGIQDLAYLEGLPYHRIAPDRLMQFGVDTTHIASQYLKDLNGNLPTHLIRESQSTPGGVTAFFENMDAYSRIDALHPLGFTTLSNLAFFYRLARTGVQPDQLREFFGAGGYVGRIAVKRGLQDLVRGGKRLKVALESDVTLEWAKILRARIDDATMHLNDDCWLFPRPEVEDGMKESYLVHPELDEDDIDRMLGSIRSIPGSHSSPASKAGTAQIANVVTFARM